MKTSSRRWLQFSLRSLLLAFLLVAVFFGGRESGRQLLEIEKRRSMAERQRAEAFAAQATRAQSQALLAQFEADRLKLEAEVQKLERQIRRLQYEAGIAERELNLRDQGDSLPTDSNGQRTRGVPINEYWQRKERPRRFIDAPRIPEPWQMVS